MKFLFFLLLLITFFSVSGAVIFVRRIKRQIAEMEDALEDIKGGNGSRRILARPHEIAAPIAYKINDIVLLYENRLLALRQTEETNKQLMTSLSHDVRTPLTTLIGYLDAVQKGIVTGEERDNYIETARRKSHSLKEYLDVLFDWFKLNSDEYAVKMVTVEAGELTRNILIDWIPVFEEMGIEYAADIPEQPFPVILDVDGYTRVLNNLIQNVVSHSRADKAAVTLSQKEGFVEITVSDNGIGIDRKDLEHIFERLYKGDTCCPGKGSGLGLSIIQQLTGKMNGKVTVRSMPGKGTAFSLLFPVSDPDHTAGQGQETHTQEGCR